MDDFLTKFIFIYTTMDPRSTTVDHFWPRTVHDYTTDWSLMNILYPQISKIRKYKVFQKYEFFQKYRHYDLIKDSWAETVRVSDQSVRETLDLISIEKVYGTLSSSH